MCDLQGVILSPGAQKNVFDLSLESELQIQTDFKSNCLHISINIHRDVDKKKKDPEKRKQSPDEQKQEWDKEIHDSFKPKQDLEGQKQESNKEAHDSYKQKHNPERHKHDSDEQMCIIEECKKALANDPFNIQAYIKMG